MSYQLVEKQVIFEGRKARLEVHHLQDDETGKRHHREVVVHGGAVVILPFLPGDRVVLVRQYRYSIGQKIVELPAGTLDRNEPPMNAAGRELLEETGYLAGRLKPIGSFFTSPGILTERMYAFAAYDLIKQTQALEEGEDIELVETGFDDAVAMVRDGEITDGKSIATILSYDRFQRGATTS